MLCHKHFKGEEERRRTEGHNSPTFYVEYQASLLNIRLINFHHLGKNNELYNTQKDVQAKV